MFARPVFAFLLAVLSSASVFAQQPATAPEAPAASKGPVLGELLKVPKYIYAWQLMVSGETPPEWVKEYTATLDGPPVPTIPVPLSGEVYTLGFTCKPGDCENNQLYVLFAPEGRDAWALLATPATGITWLGRPDQRIQDAITGALRK
jgi:Inhibitor of vertebrate lysozyme (Ivy)